MNYKYECPNCGRKSSIDEMDLNEETHTLNCPNCNNIIIEGYRGEQEGEKK